MYEVEDLIMVCCSDFSGQLRGKAFPAADWEERKTRGMGWVPTNMQITAFDTIAESPFGALGDLMLVPVEDTKVQMLGKNGEPAEQFCIGELFEMTGEPWSLCLRSCLENSIKKLEEIAGVKLVVAFEHEFSLNIPESSHKAFSLRSFRERGTFPKELFAAYRRAGIEPDSFIPEYGQCQYEATCKPKSALRAADEAILLREITRSVAARHDLSASFSPVPTLSGVGNGLHIHFSFRDLQDRPVSYDPSQPYGMSKTTGVFVGGILKYLPSMMALLAPTNVSYHRLVPHKWSSAYNNLGYRDREAAVRICPVPEVKGVDPAHAYNLEIRATDAAASPYLQLAAIILAGCQGLVEELSVPNVTDCDVSSMSESELVSMGIQRLPQSLEQALSALNSDHVVRGWFPEPLIDSYLKHKKAEIEYLDGKSPAEQCALYANAY